MTDTLMVGVSGIRGIVGKDLTNEVVGRYARAFGRWAKARKPVVVVGRDARESGPAFERAVVDGLGSVGCAVVRSEEHTSELQSLAYLVCRLLLEKKNIIEMRFMEVTTKSIPALSCLHSDTFIVR